MAKRPSSGNLNWLTDAFNILAQQPLARPVQNKTLDSFSNSRGSMYPKSTAGTGGGLTTTKVKTVDVDKDGNIIPLNPEAKPGIPLGDLKPPAESQYGGGGGIKLGYGGDAAKQVPGVTPWGDPALYDLQPGAKPVAKPVAKPGGILPAWTSRARADRFNGVAPKLDIPGYYTRPKKGTAVLPVENMTPEVAAAYAAVERGEAGAGKNLANLLADQAQAGDIGRASVSGGGIKIGSGGGGGGSVPAGQPVRIATGKTATSGQTYQQGSSGSGKPYTYQVQGDGSIKNMTTGRTTAPATRR